MKLKKARIFDQLGKGGGAEPTHHLPGYRHRHKQHPVLGQGQTPATPAASPALRCTQARQQTAAAEFSGLAKLGMPSDPRRKIFSSAHTEYPATSPAAAT